MDNYEIDSLMKMIDESMLKSWQKKSEIDNLENQMYVEAAPIKLQDMKKELETKKEDKRDFDDRTINALKEEAKLIQQKRDSAEEEFLSESLRIQSRRKELEQGKIVKELQAKKEKILNRLATLEKSEASEDELKKSRDSAQLGIQKLDIQISKEKGNISEEIVKLDKEKDSLKKSYNSELKELNNYDYKVDKYAENLDAEKEVEKARDEVRRSLNKNQPQISNDKKPTLEPENVEPEEKKEEIKEDQKENTLEQEGANNSQEEAMRRIADRWVDYFNKNRPESVEQTEQGNETELRSGPVPDQEQEQEQNPELNPDLENTEDISRIQEAINSNYEIVVDNNGANLTINGEKILVDAHRIRTMMDIQKKDPIQFMSLIAKHLGIAENEFSTLSEAKNVLAENGFNPDIISKIDPTMLACASKLSKINESEKGTVLLNQYLKAYQGEERPENMSITYDLRDLSKRARILQRLFTTKNYFNLGNKIELAKRAEIAENLGIANIEGVYKASRMDKFFGRFEKDTKNIKALGPGLEKEFNDEEQVQEQEELEPELEQEMERIIEETQNRIEPEEQHENGGQVENENNLAEKWANYFKENKEAIEKSSQTDAAKDYRRKMEVAQKVNEEKAIEAANKKAEEKENEEKEEEESKE